MMQAGAGRIWPLQKWSFLWQSFAHKDDEVTFIRAIPTLDASSAGCGWVCDGMCVCMRVFVRGDIYQVSS